MKRRLTSLIYLHEQRGLAAAQLCRLLRSRRSCTVADDERQSAYRKVYLCLDNDKPGQQAAERIIGKLVEKGIPSKSLTPTLKDWNEDLLFTEQEENHAKYYSFDCCSNGYVLCAGRRDALAHIYNLNNIKSKTVGDGQHGTARFSTKAEIRRIYKQVPFTPEEWRKKAKKNTLPRSAAGNYRRLSETRRQYYRLCG